MAGLIEPNQPGKREDLSDLIAMADAKSTPVTSMMPKGKALSHSTFNWQADGYDDPDTEGVLDGADVVTFDNKAANRKMLDGRVQKVRKSWAVSDFSENLSNVAGIASEKARAKAHCIENLKRNIESVICSDNDSQAQEGTDPYKTRGLGEWIKATAQTDLPVPESFRTPAASINTTAMASLTETLVQDVLESVYNETGKRGTYVMPCGTKLKRAFTGFSLYVPDKASHLAVRRHNAQESMKIESTISVFEGDFGTINLIPSLFLAVGTADAPSRRGYLLTTDMLELRYLRTPGGKELEDQGGGPRGYVDAIFALCVKNPLGLGKFAATS